MVKVFEWRPNPGTATHCSKAAHTTFDWVVHCFMFGMSGLKIGYRDRFFVLFLNPFEVNAKILLYIRL